MKYMKSTIVSAKNNGKIIEGTVFQSGDTDKYTSKKNKNALTKGSGFTTLRYKLATAVASSQSSANECSIFYTEDGDSRYLLGCFPGGSKNPTEFEYFLLNLETRQHCATNMYSHYLPMMILAYQRYLHVGDELDRFYRALDFTVPTIDVNQKKPFYMVNSCLEIAFNDIVINTEFENELTPAEFQELFQKEYKSAVISDKTVDITAFLKNNYDVPAKAALKLARELASVKVEVPQEIEVKKSPGKRLSDLKKKYFEGIQTFTEQELDAMPLLLKNGYDLAKSSFLMNRDFFELQEWELVDAIACGDVHSINFTGPAGTGKTTTIRSIAGALGMPFVLVGGSANIEETDLLGTRGVEAKDGVSVTTWTDGPITSAIRYGAFLLFDEVNSADPGILMKLNTILDGSKSMILSTAEEVQVHPKFVYSEAMNVGVAYAGTDQMNQSHFDRLDEMFKISPKTPQQEADILEKVTGYHNKEVLVAMARIKEFILEQINGENGDASEQICSLRRLISWVRKARRTGEFVESALTTVIAHLTVYDDTVQRLTIEDIQESDSIAQVVLGRIIEDLGEENY